MIILSFHRAKSKNFDGALKLARLFDTFSDQGETLSITLTLKDVFERWQFFNDLFWLVVDWKGTYVEYNDMKFYSHCDMTRIFYSLQQSHNNWITFTNYKLANCYRIYNAENSLEEIITEYLTDEEINRIIEVYNIKKRNTKLLQDDNTQGGH